VGSLAKTASSEDYQNGFGSHSGGTTCPSMSRRSLRRQFRLQLYTAIGSYRSNANSSLDAADLGVTPRDGLYFFVTSGYDANVIANRNLPQTVAANMRAEMGRYSLDQDDVARILGITRGAVSHKLHGKRPITLMEIDAFALALGLDPADLLRPHMRKAAPGGTAFAGLVAGTGFEPATSGL
jgi:hypothetical protein